MENAVYIENREIAKAFYDEWQQLELISDELDWKTEGMEPEHLLFEGSEVVDYEDDNY